MNPAKPPMQAPTAVELLVDLGVQTGLDEAWIDSQAGAPPGVRHEEGGWIYLDLKTGQMKTARAMRGTQGQIDLSSPLTLPDCVVVGKFHTHPNPISEGWITGPSPDDLAVDMLHGVPDLIRAEDGTHCSGPDCRRGGLGGGPGYPP